MPDLISLCPARYSRTDTSELAQITQSADQRKSWVKEEVKGPASQMLGNWGTVYPRIKKSIASSVYNVKQEFLASPASKSSTSRHGAEAGVGVEKVNSRLAQVQLFGYDYLVDESGRYIARGRK